MIYPDDFQGPLVDSDGVLARLKGRAIRFCLSAVHRDTGPITSNQRSGYATVELLDPDAKPRLAADITQLTMTTDGVFTDVISVEVERWQLPNGALAARTNEVKCSDDDKDIDLRGAVRLGAPDYPAVEPVTSRTASFGVDDFC